MRLSYRVSIHRVWYAAICFFACERAGTLALEFVGVDGHPTAIGWLYGALTVVLVALCIFHAVAALKLESERFKAWIRGRFA